MFCRKISVCIDLLAYEAVLISLYILKRGGGNCPNIFLSQTPQLLHEIAQDFLRDWHAIPYVCYKT